MLTNWTLTQEADIPALSSTLTSCPHTYAAPTPTQISGTPATDASLVANALQQQQQQPPLQRGAGGREADGGRSVSWCKEQYWGEGLATCSGSTCIGWSLPFFPLTCVLAVSDDGMKMTTMAQDSDAKTTAGRPQGSVNDDSHSRRREDDRAMGSMTTDDEGVRMMTPTITATTKSLGRWR